MFDQNYRFLLTHSLPQTAVSGLTYVPRCLQATVSGSGIIIT